MKYELEFRNLEQIRQLLCEGKQFEACTMLLALGDLLIKNGDVHSMQPAILLGQYSKVSKQLLTLYNTLIETFSPENELKQYEIRLQDVKYGLQQVQREYSTLEAKNAELFSQEEVLQEEKGKLEKLIAKVEELKNLKEKEIQQLKSEYLLLKKNLDKLNVESKNAQSLLESYQSELSEDGRLIQNLPEQYGTIQNVDSLIAELKEQEHQAHNLHRSYEQGLITLIEQIRFSYENLKGNSHG